MVKPAPASPLKMTQSQFLFQFLVIAFNDPAVFSKVHKVSQRQVCGKSREPVFCGLTFTFRPFDQKPFLRMRLRAPVIAMCRAHTNRGKPGSQSSFTTLAPTDVLPGLRGQAES